MQLCRILPVILLILSSDAVAAVRIGGAAVGLGAFSRNSVIGLSDCVVSAGGEVEIAALAYSFNASGLFTNWTLLVQSTLPRINGRLYLTTYLDDGPNRRGTRGVQPYFQSNVTYQAFWRTLSPSSKPSDQAKYRQFLLDWGNEMVRPFYDWVIYIRDWASVNGYADRLELIVVPVLEDDARANLIAYENLLSATRSLLQGTAMHYRRNPNNWVNNGVFNAGFRINGVPIEFHTNRRSIIESGLAAGYVRAGDVINNDGSFVLYPGESDPGLGGEAGISISRFRSNQVFFEAKGLSSLLWRFEFNANGAPRKLTLPPDKRGVLTPLEDATSIDRLIRTFQFR